MSTLKEDEARMSRQGNPLLFFVLLIGGLLQAAAQNAGVDAGVLAKANGGDAAAQVQAGESCAAQHDYVQAAAWYKKAAEQNSIAGELHLAALYRDGGDKAFPRDVEQAASWYRKAAEQGDATAQGTLGTLYTLGQGVTRSDVEAYYWLDLAASVKGPNQAQYAANRQIVGTRITADELADVEDRVAKWKAAHPRPDSMQ
ncbi:MAG TPA: tetratricopeptide repeat protein [Terracidiphilus sp.]|nr:tetratricopeptide repeat protein [Terracidiphilus sp.]